ncbi:MAG: class I SAM-dependent methyltransferase [Patescibacteria group bacterium]|nr:class I SAM-dependent methyltransferase [Patescibacteria group bacterium]
MVKLWIITALAGCFFIAFGGLIGDTPIITPKEYYKELFKNFTIPKNAAIYELGCGKGDFLFAAEKFLPRKIIGVELSLLHILYGKIKAKFKHSKVKFYYQNFFKTDISDANIIYLFLVEPIVIKIWDKIKKEAKPGTMVIVLSDKIPNEKIWQRIATRPQDKNTTYFHLYRV